MNQCTHRLTEIRSVAVVGGRGDSLRIKTTVTFLPTGGFKTTLGRIWTIVGGTGPTNNLRQATHGSEKIQLSSLIILRVVCSSFANSEV